LLADEIDQVAHRQFAGPPTSSAETTRACTGVPSISRRINSLRAKPRQLQPNDVALGGIGDEIADRGRIRRHRG